MMLIVQETDLVFDGVAVRMYEPVKRSGVLSGIVYFHGGGFVFGNLGKDCKTDLYQLPIRVPIRGLVCVGGCD